LASLPINDAQEAHYLTAILNSSVLDELIKKHQPKGKFGPRHITRLPFEFGIPKFDYKNELHERIAELSIEATKEAAPLPRMSRLKIKAAIPSMKEIDRLVTQLLKKA
jgi:ribonuclease BN (tRNA processing enzyme)